LRKLVKKTEGILGVKWKAFLTLSRMLWLQTIVRPLCSLQTLHKVKEHILDSLIPKIPSLCFTKEHSRIAIFNANCKILFFILKGGI
jgi:hypothetical protein